MSTKKILLEPDKYYHIFNRGINSMNLFRDSENYVYFLNLYDKYIEPVANTFAWVLMKNHFHFLVKIKTKEEIIIAFRNLQDFKNPKEQEIAIVKRIYQQFSNMFNAYTKAINKRYNRTGALFESNFHRKLIDNPRYFKNVVIYIHQNPVHHHICEHPIEYAWSSYLTCVSSKPTKLYRDKVISWFDNNANFKKFNNDNNFDYNKTENYLF